MRRGRLSARATRVEAPRSPRGPRGPGAHVALARRTRPEHNRVMFPPARYGDPGGLPRSKDQSPRRRAARRPADPAADRALPRRRTGQPPRRRNQAARRLAAIEAPWTRAWLGPAHLLGHGFAGWAALARRSRRATAAVGARLIQKSKSKSIRSQSRSKTGERSKTRAASVRAAWSVPRGGKFPAPLSRPGPPPPSAARPRRR